MTTLYHYCSNESFYSIIEKRSIWLSLLSLSNDSLEGKLVYEILTQIAKDNKLGVDDFFTLQEYLKLFHQIFDGLGFCLSGARDLLSQWCMYANDASGFSIGFSKEYLRELSKLKKNHFALHEVEYNHVTQKKSLQPAYNKLIEIIRDYKKPTIGELLAGGGYEDKKFIELLKASPQLFINLFTLKAKAFIQEKESRLLSHVIKSEMSKCSFRPMNDKIIPYIKIELSSLNLNPINEIIIGPKNKTPKYIIENFLEQNKFDNVKISSSEASYQ